MLRLPAVFLSLILLSSTGLAINEHLPGFGPPVLAVDVDNNIVNKYNDRYTVALNVSGTLVHVTLDTGSTDLWMQSPEKLAFRDTGVLARISYGDGRTFVNGTIGLGALEFAGFDIPQQAFINVTQNVGLGWECTYRGVCGTLGLGFDNHRSAIPNKLTEAGFNGNITGRSVLSNVFAQQPNMEQFFAFSLSRLGDMEDSPDASLTIGAYDDEYANVQYAPKLPQYPEKSNRWSILTHGITVEHQTIPWKSYSNSTPYGQLVALLDTGTTNFLVPEEIRDAIYSKVPGAVLAKNSSIGNAHFSEDRDVWVIPCTTAINFTTSFGGQMFTIHPLDLTDLTTRKGPDNKTYTVCSGSITNGGEILGHGWDALYGDSFLRNTYTVFAFGNETTSPYVQLLSQNDAGAAADFKETRARILANSPIELSPKDLIALFDGPSSDSCASTPPIAGKASVNLAESPTDSQISMYGPIIVGLLTANLVLLLVLTFIGILHFIRNGWKRGATRSAAYVPVKVKEDAFLSRQSLAEERSYFDST